MGNALEGEGPWVLAPAPKGAGAIPLLSLPFIQWPLNAKSRNTVGGQEQGLGTGSLLFGAVHISLSLTPSGCSPLPPVSYSQSSCLSSDLFSLRGASLTQPFSCNYNFLDLHRAYTSSRWNMFATEGK